MSDIVIDGDEAVAALATGVRALSERSYLLGAVGFKIRDRVLESERRLFRAAPWPARRPSTIKRYRYPLRSMADDALHRTTGRGPLVRHGLLERTLTTPQAPGQRDSVQQALGGLNVAFGLKARGPVAYGGMQASASGRRRRRDPFRFDDIAHGDATADVVEHIIGRFGDAT